MTAFATMAAASELDGDDDVLHLGSLKGSSVYGDIRQLRRANKSLFNRLCSVDYDARFAAEVRAHCFPALPLVANLRCGLWYAPHFDSHAYFKSTDGHPGQWDFSVQRLNFHVAMLCAERGGCVVLDSTRKGRTLPDSFSKTIPIWCAVMNTAVQRHRGRMQHARTGTTQKAPTVDVDVRAEGDVGGEVVWDCTLHTPPSVVSASEHQQIAALIGAFADKLEACGADIGALSAALARPLRPLWITPKSRLFGSMSYSSLDFTPVVCISVSEPVCAGSPPPTKLLSLDSNGASSDADVTSISFPYVQGAGDDEELWSRGLTAALFWRHRDAILAAGASQCEGVVRSFVSSARLHEATRGDRTHAGSNPDGTDTGESRGSDSLAVGQYAFVPGTNVAVGLSAVASVTGARDLFGLVVDCTASGDGSDDSDGWRVCLGIGEGKRHRTQLRDALPRACVAVKNALVSERRVLVCCASGSDVSVAVAIAALLYLRDAVGGPDIGDGLRSCAGAAVSESGTTDGALKDGKGRVDWKAGVSRVLTRVAAVWPAARPSRASLKAVRLFLSDAAG